MCVLNLHYNNLWHKIKLSLSSYFVSKQYITLELKSVLETCFFCSSVISIRDLLAWVNFMNTLTPQLTPEEAFYHGAHLVFLDAMGCGSTGDGGKMKSEAIQFLMRLMETHGIALPGDDNEDSDMEGSHEGLFGIPAFFIERGC